MIRKILFAIVVAVFSSMATFAEEGSGSCKVQGTDNDYVEATAYLHNVGNKIEGSVTISNSSSKPLMSYRLEVTAEVLWHGWKQTTLLSSTMHKKCEPYMSTEIPLTSVNGTEVRNVQVKISNATCSN